MNQDHSPETILEQALELSDLQERVSYLDEVCGNDEALRGEIESLLAAAFAADAGFMDTLADPVWGEVPGEKEGDTIGRYRLLQQIGEGGFGTVYMAEQTEPVKRRVALKVIKAGMDSKEVIARFEAERQALALMDHPNIAKVHDAGTTEGGRPYFVMELVKGLPITKYCADQDLDTKARLVLFADVCAAVQHAHQKGIIHRDLKPSNILVSPHDGKPVVKVIDFGIAKAISMELTEKTVFTQLGRMIGTPQYMSPEQAELNALDVDTRSDIYSLGVVLYELLTGTTPLDGEKLRSAAYGEMQRLIREETPVKPSTRVSTAARQVSINHAPDSRALRGDLDWIVMKALEKERERRYETANGFAADIRRFLDQEPVSAGPPRIGYKMRKFVRRNRTTVAVATTITVLLVAGIFGTSWFAVLSQEAKEEALRHAKETKVALEEAEAALKESHYEEAKGWLEKARLHQSQGNDFAAAMMAAKGLGFRGFGAERQSEEFRKTHAVLLDRDKPEFDQLMQIAMAGSGSSRPVWQTPLASDHGNDISTFAFSPDGATLASHDSNATINLFSISTGKKIRSLHGHSISVSSVAFSPDGEILASAGMDQTIKLWDPSSGKEIGSIESSADFLAFSPDGLILASSGWNEATKLWDVSTRKVVRTIGKKADFLAFSPDGGTLAVGNDESIMLWDLSAGKEIQSLYVRWSDEGWEGVATEKELRSLGRATESSISSLGGLGFTSVAFSPDGTTLAAGSYVNVIMIWDIPTKKLTRFLQGHQTPVYGVAFSPDGTTLASGAMDETIKLWDVTTGRELQSLWGRQGPVSPGDFTPQGGGGGAVGSVAFSPDGLTLASGSTGETLKLWNLPNVKKARSLEGQHGWGWQVAHSPDGAMIAGVVDSTPHCMVKLWDGSSGKELQSSARHFDRPWCLAFTPDGAIVASRGDDNSIEIWSAATGKEIRSIEGHHSLGSIFAFSLDGSILASGVKDEPIKLWKVSTGEEIRSLEGNIKGLTSMAFSRDSRHISISEGETIKLWDVPTGRELWSRMGDLDVVLGMVFSPDGATIASFGLNEIKVWDVSTGEVLRSFEGHQDYIQCLSFSPDGKILASGSYDETIKLWDPSTGREVRSLEGDQGEINSVAFSPNGTALASANSGGTIRIWSISCEPLDLAGYLDPRRSWCQLEGPKIVWTTQPPEQDRDIEFEFINVFPSSHVGILRSTASVAEKNRDLFWNYLHAENWNSAQVMYERLTDPPIRETAREMTVLKRAAKAQSAFDRGLYDHAGWHLREITLLLKSEEVDPAMSKAKELINRLKDDLDKSATPD